MILNLLQLVPLRPSPYQRFPIRQTLARVFSNHYGFMPTEFLSDTENEDDEMDDELEKAAEGESEEESAEETEEAATDGSENEEVHERGREWKDARKAIRGLLRGKIPHLQGTLNLCRFSSAHNSKMTITLETILDLHKAVMEADGQNEAAGQLRTCNVRVGKFNPMDYTRVPGAMNLFIEWLRVQMAAGHMSAGELSARAQCRLVYIHPFLDGNRRTSRLLMNMILTRRHFNPVVVPEEKRQLYYRLIEKCNKRKYKGFIQFICFLQQCTKLPSKNFPNKKMLKLHS